MKIEGLEHLKDGADGRKRKEVMGVSNRGRVCKSWEISATAQNFIEREREGEVAILGRECMNVHR